jgi:membrane-bound lytic murein transglycosylase D
VSLVRVPRLALLALVLALAACQAPRRSTPSDELPVARELPAPASAPILPAPPPPPPPEAAKPEAVAPPSPLTGADLFARLRQRLADPPCVQDRVVQRWERLYARSTQRLSANLASVLPLLALVLDELEDHHLPAEYALLPIVESWYRPDAGSPRSAYGMWQFTSATARHFGLRVGGAVDERLMPRLATRAAVRYLAGLQNEFGDWKLANMAFNAGEFRLKRALARAPATAREVSAAAHRPPGLSMTTYEHVAKVQALACLLAQPRRFGLQLPDDTEVVPLLTVRTPPGIGSLEALARRTGIDAATATRLNPAWRRALPAGATVLLPAPAAARLGTSRAATTAMGGDAPAAASPAPSGAKEHRVAPGDTLGAIAQRYGVPLDDLMRWNGMGARTLIHPGQRVRLEP